LTLSVFTVYPLTDARWGELVSRHPRASVFHTSGWLSALQRTYAYEPVAFTTNPPGEPLKNSLVFCKIKSWITGRRLVSLPFSDHCDLLADSAAEQEELLGHVCALVARDGYTHAEMRPTTSQQPVAAAYKESSERYCLHTLSLEAPLDTLFRNLHKSCIQRKIQRAEREGLSYESGRSEPLLLKFYDLQLRTRRRHGLPPQPLRWFRNLVQSMGDDLTIRVVSKGCDPLAAMITLSHKNTVTYKYGCSDERFHKLGGTPSLFWKTIQEVKNQGMQVLDLGRSESGQAGLVQFKDRLGAVRTMLPYWRYPAAKNESAERPAWQRQIARRIFSMVPDSILVTSGRFLYRHVG
jgi:hypothetical protein